MKIGNKTIDYHPTKIFVSNKTEINNKIIENKVPIPEIPEEEEEEKFEIRINEIKYLILKN